MVSQKNCYCILFFIRISQNSCLGYFLSTHFKTKYKIDNNKTKTKPEVCAKVPDFGTVALWTIRNMRCHVTINRCCHLVGVATNKKRPHSSQTQKSVRHTAKPPKKGTRCKPKSQIRWGAGWTKIKTTSQNQNQTKYENTQSPLIIK